MAKEKIITFESQLERMNELHGIPVEDAVNVFSNFKKTIETIIGEEADSKTETFSFETPLGSIGFNWVEEKERINSTDGVKYTAPAHYVGSYGFVVDFLDIANKNVDLSTIPGSVEIAKSKKVA